MSSSWREYRRCHRRSPRRTALHPRGAKSSAQDARAVRPARSSRGNSEPMHPRDARPLRAPSLRGGRSVRVVHSLRVGTALAGSGVLLLGLACGPVHSVTVGKNDPPHEHDERGVYEHPGRGHGPPPHAPAHGYRWKQKHAYHHQEAEVELVFDSGLGVYVVLGLPAHYYWEGTYLRVDGGHWCASHHLDVGWHLYAEDSLPACPARQAREVEAAQREGTAPGQAPLALQRDPFRFGGWRCASRRLAEDALVVDLAQLALDLVEHLIGGRARLLRIGMGGDVGVLAGRVPVHAKPGPFSDRQLESVRPRETRPRDGRNGAGWIPARLHRSRRH